MKVSLINYEENFNINGILSKYAYKMAEELKRIGVDVRVVSIPDSTADINHHINYFSYRKSGVIDTLQVTHITNQQKLERVREGLQTAFGVCFSKETEDYLRKEGMENLTTILPAHDGYPRKIKSVLISTNVYPDGCKREQMFYELLKNIDCRKFNFYVMGKGWNFEGINANIQYLDHFEKDDYAQLLLMCDYNLYFGEDEGSMGVLDAKQSGLQIIAPNTGFHREIGIDYPFHTQEELQGIFERLQANPVEDWTWAKYALEHKTLWEKLRK